MSNPYAATLSTPPAEGSVTREIVGVDVLSVGRLFGGLYGAIGLLIGLIYAGVGVIAGVVGAAVNGDPSALIVVPIALVAAVLFVVVYGGLGFVGGLILSALYNLAAGRLGGVRVRLRDVAG